MVLRAAFAVQIENQVYIALDNLLDNIRARTTQAFRLGLTSRYLDKICLGPSLKT